MKRSSNCPEQIAGDLDDFVEDTAYDLRSSIAFPIGLSVELQMPSCIIFGRLKPEGQALRAPSTDIPKRPTTP